MWEIAVETTLQARHKLCTGGLHKHHWTVRATFRAWKLHKGWVLDFRDAGKRLRSLIEPYDGKLLNELAPFDRIVPTRENIAFFFAEQLGEGLPETVRVHRIDIEEGSDRASYVSTTSTEPRDKNARMEKDT